MTTLNFRNMGLHGSGCELCGQGGNLFTTRFCALTKCIQQEYKLCLWPEIIIQHVVIIWMINCLHDAYACLLVVINYNSEEVNTYTFYFFIYCIEIRFLHIKLNYIIYFCININYLLLEYYCVRIEFELNLIFNWKSTLTANL